MPKLNQRLKQADSLAGLLLALLLSLLFALYLLPHNFIQGNSSYWLSQHDDITQYIAGFNAYFSEPWHYPLFKIESLNYPLGTRSTFVDIIPLYSFLLKLFLPASLAPFNPFGYWILFSFLMQGAAAWFITRALNLNSYLALIALTILFSLYPALLARLGHISLMSHFIILFSLALYLRATKKPYQPLLWTTLLTISLYINIYLFTMSLTIFFATITTNYQKLSHKKNLTQALLPFILIALTLLITILPLPDGKFAQDFGWGYYSMNLLSPIYGGAFISISTTMQDGQYEGFNYIGLGVISLLLYALYLQKKYDNTFFIRHRYMLILLTLFFIYSLSYRVYFGSQLIAELNYPHFLDTLVHHFRASGRFFWAVGYALIIFSVVTIIKHKSKKTALIIITVALLIQIADLRVKLKEFKTTAKRDSTIHLDMQAFKQKVGEGVKHIYFYPKFRCSKYPPHNTILPTMLFASQNKMTLNTGYIARYQPDCNDTKEEILSSDKNSSIYLFAKDEFTQEQIQNFFTTKTTCSTLELFTLCKETK